MWFCVHITNIGKKNNSLSFFLLVYVYAQNPPLPSTKMAQNVDGDGKYAMPSTKMQIFVDGRGGEKRYRRRAGVSSPKRNCGV